MSWGVGQSEIVHILATQTSVQRLPKTMRIRIEGRAPAWVTPKDIILNVIGRIIRPARPHAASAEELAAHSAFVAKLKDAVWLS